MRLIAAVPPGITELGCHPGRAADLDTMYRDERAQEVAALCDPRVRATVWRLGVRLCSFYDVTGGSREGASPDHMREERSQ